MASPRAYLDLTLAGWLDELSTSNPVPGSGSALAYAVASGAAVLVLAARASQPEWPGATGAAAQAVALRDRAAPLAQRDAEAYAAAHEARRRAVGDRALGEAFAAAAEPPLELARLAADVAELAGEIAAGGNPAVRADAVAVAALAAGAARGAVALVAANLTASEGDLRVLEAERAADAAARAATLL